VICGLKFRIVIAQFWLHKFVFLQVLDLVVHMNHARPMSTAAASKVPVGARKV
jgi:hypothetical protein